MEHLQTTEKVHDELLLHRRVDLLLRTGKLLVESLADTNRVVRNMKRTAAFLGIPEEKLHINVSFTMLMVNVSDGDYSFTKFQRIPVLPAADSVFSSVATGLRFSMLQ